MGQGDSQGLSGDLFPGAQSPSPREAYLRRELAKLGADPVFSELFLRACLPWGLQSPAARRAAFAAVSMPEAQLAALCDAAQTA